MVRSLRHTLYGLAAFLGVIAVGAVLAQANPAPTLVGVQARGPVSGGLSVMATFRAMPGTGAANAAFYSVPATLSPTTVGTLARGVMTRAAPVAAVAAAVAGVGWFIDQATQQIMSGNPQFPAPIPTGEFFYTGLGGKRFATPEAAARAMIPFYPQFAPMTFQRVECQQIGPDLIACSAYFLRNGNIPLGPVGFSGERNTGAPIQPERDAIPVPVDQVGQLIINSPATWPGVLANADGSPVRTPELVAAGQALGAQLAQGSGPAQSAGWDTGAQGGEPAPLPQPQPQPGTGTNPQPVNLEFPEFCSWASVVCEFIDWFRLDDLPPDEVEVPEVEVETLRVPWSSGLGGGSCPASPTVTIREGWDVSFPVDPMCDLGNLLRPLVILLASILSVYIIVGGTRAS